MMKRHNEDISQYEVRLAEARNATKHIATEKSRLQDDLDEQLSVTEALKVQYSDNIVALQTKLSLTQEQLMR